MRSYQIMDTVFVKKVHRQARRFWIRQTIYYQTNGIVRPIVFFLVLFSFGLLLYKRFSTNYSNLELPNQRVAKSRNSSQSLTLFIAIGSAPKNSDLRQALRNSWLAWISNHEDVAYRFFTDAPPQSIRVPSLVHEPREVWHALEEEAHSKEDLVLQPLPSGYGDREHNAYGRRALYQMDWVLEHYPSFDYFLRVDDDSFLCVDKLLYELKSAPKENYFWGRYWCKEGRNRADENFMLFSNDIVHLIGDHRYIGKLIPFDEEVTFGWNFGYLSWILNLTIFDDQARIDAQQGLLTKYMHNESHVSDENNSRFCQRFIYAHHVIPQAMIKTYQTTQKHMMYSIPVRTTPRETCAHGDRSFISARHSRRLPDVKIIHSLDAPS